MTNSHLSGLLTAPCCILGKVKGQWEPVAVAGFGVLPIDLLRTTSRIFIERFGVQGLERFWLPGRLLHVKRVG